VGGQDTGLVILSLWMKLELDPRIGYLHHCALPKQVSKLPAN